MNQYITGTIIKKLRENKGMTQSELAEKLNVSNKAVSKWENGKGYPDISLIEPLADVLGISVIELLQGEAVINTNRHFNTRNIKFYICPVCGNVIVSGGEAIISCCGITLLPSEADDVDELHRISIEPVEDEYYIQIDHPMTKNHFISFIAAIGDSGYDIMKLYPEGTADCRFKRSSVRYIYYYCNRDGLFKVPVKRRKQSTL